MQFANSVTVQRPPSAVFAFLAEPANIPKWNYAIVSTRQLTPGPVGVGTRLEQTRSIPRPSVEQLEVTDFVPGKRLALHGDLGPLTGTLAYELEAIPGGTRLTNVADLYARGPARLVAPLLTGRIREAVAANLETLRQLLESSA